MPTTTLKAAVRTAVVSCLESKEYTVTANSLPSSPDSMWQRDALEPTCTLSETEKNYYQELGETAIPQCIFILLFATLRGKPGGFLKVSLS
jgi:hypothetical protein